MSFGDTGWKGGRGSVRALQVAGRGGYSGETLVCFAWRLRGQQKEKGSVMSTTQRDWLLLDLVKRGTKDK